MDGAGVEAAGEDDRRDRGAARVSPGDDLEVAEGGRPAGEASGRSGRRAVIDERWAGRIGELLAPPAAKLLATQRVRDHRGRRGSTGRYPTRGPLSARAARPAVPGGAGGERADRDRPGRGVPVRLVGLHGLGRGGGVWDELWCFGTVLCWSRVAEVVVRDVDRPGAHLRGPGPVLRGRRRGARRWAAPTGWARSARRRASGSSCHPPALDFARHHGVEFEGVPGRRRQTQRQGRATVPRPEGELPDRARRSRPPGDDRRAQPAGRAWLARRVHARAVMHAPANAPAERARDRAAAAGPAAPSAVRHRLRRDPPGASPVPADRVGRRVATRCRPSWSATSSRCRQPVDADIVRAALGGAARRRSPLAAPGRDRSGVGPGTPRRRRGDRPWPSPAGTCASSTPHRRSSSAADRALLELGGGDYDVDTPDLDARYGGCGCTGRGRDA